ncbi:MAG: hypothetical protein U0Y68_02520 [Blastocatellia bacterium]
MPSINAKLEQTITWTLVPKEILKGQLALSLIATPRLVVKPDGVNPLPDKVTLEAFPNWKNWPQWVQANFSSVKVRFGGVAVPAKRATDANGQDVLITGRWDAVFPPQTIVKPYDQPDLRTLAVVSQNLKNLAAEVRQGYDQFAERLKTAQDLPSLKEAQTLAAKNADKLGSMLKGVVTHAQMMGTPTLRAAIDSKVQAALKDGLPVDAKLFTAATGSAMVGGLFALNRFSETQHRWQTSKKPRLMNPDDITFHEIVTLLSDYPLLMRQLGLVIDLVVEMKDVFNLLPALPQPNVPIQLEMNWGALEQAEKAQEQAAKLTPVTRLHRIPMTLCDMIVVQGAVRTFQLKANTPQIKDGLFDLSNLNDLTYQEAGFDKQDFDLHLSDFEMVGKQLQSMGDTLLRSTTTVLRNHATIKGSTTQQLERDKLGLPSLRSTGIAIFYDAKGANFRQSKRRAAELNNNLNQWQVVINGSEQKPPTGKEIILTTEDLLRGYRVDVRWQGDTPWSQWMSLCQRNGKYTFINTNEVLERPDEGYVKANSIVWGRDETDRESLAVHEALFRWDGWSLCVPRPGKFVNPENGEIKSIEELRTADVSSGKGKSQPFKTTFSPVAGSLPRLRFGWKYRLRVRLVDLAGNSNPWTRSENTGATKEVLYTRFDPIPPPLLVPPGVPRENMKDNKQEDYSPGESLERMVIRSDVDLTAERYFTGVLKAKNVPKPTDPQQGVTYHEMNDRLVLPPKTSQSLAETHGKFDSGEVKYLQIVAGDQAHLPITFTRDTKVNYLPDPQARGAAFVGLPNSSLVGGGPLLQPTEVSLDPTKSLRVVNVPFAGKWPNQTPFILRIRDLVAGTTRLQWDTTTPIPVLTVFLEKAEILHVRYSSCLSTFPKTTNAEDLSALDLMGVWRKSVKDKPNDATAHRPRALSGADPMLTPFHHLVLVHAVQRPLKAPAFQQLQPATRTPGQTFIDLATTATLDAKSTARLEVLADWEEWVDDVKAPAPARVKRNAALRSYHTDGNDTVTLSTTQEKSQVTPLDADPLRQEFGDTKFREVFYSLRATTSFREYFPADITDDINNISVIGPQRGTGQKPSPTDTTKMIPQGNFVWNTARPIAPKVLYIVPTFKWSRNWDATHPPQGNEYKSQREGKALRVYLERPWYSSGDGELLAVLLKAPNIPMDDKLKPYVTQWGKDPIYASNSPRTQLKITDFKQALFNRLADSGLKFKLASDLNNGLALDELGTARQVIAVGHEVNYDAARKLWYCDIELDLGASYYPFVRLALARYQPNSIDGMELSRVVLTDFAQPAPDRSISVKRSTSASGAVNLQVEISGVIPRNTWANQDAKNVFPPDKNGFKEGDGLNQFELRVESLAPGANPDFANLDFIDGDSVISHPELGWEKVTATTLRPSLPPSDLLPVWLSNLGFQRPPNDNKRYRLVVQEFEWFENGGLFTIEGHTSKKVSKRLVFTETFDLGSGSGG